MAEESQIEAYLRVEMRKRGGKAYKWVSPGNPGVPDRIIVFGGQVVFVELKASGETLSRRQELRIAELRRMGGRVCVLEGLEEVKRFIREVVEGDMF